MARLTRWRLSSTFRACQAATLSALASELVASRASCRQKAWGESTSEMAMRVIMRQDECLNGPQLRGGRKNINSSNLNCLKNPSIPRPFEAYFLFGHFVLESKENHQQKKLNEEDQDSTSGAFAKRGATIHTETITNENLDLFFSVRFRVRYGKTKEFPQIFFRTSHNNRPHLRKKNA